MNVIILAAGYGTRLGALTANTAKPLLNIGGKLLIDHILEKVKNLPGISVIYIVTNNKFYPDFERWQTSAAKHVPCSLHVINDGTTCNEDRLGSIGDIYLVIQNKKINDDVLIIGGDNLFEDDLRGFLSFFNKNGSSILLHDVQSRELAKSLGIATVNDRHHITSFIEKPENPSSTLASTLIYAIQQKHLSFVEKAIQEGKADRAGDFIRYLSERETVHGVLLNGRWFDIGTPQAFADAEAFFRR